MEVKNTKEIKSPYINMLLYGQSGTGKTTTASTFVNALYLNIESGIVTLKGKDIDYVDIESWDDLIEVYLKLKSKELDYDTVIIDSVTELANRRFDEVKGNREEMNRHLWGILTGDIKKFLRNFRDLEMNVVFIFLSEEKEDGNTVLVRPSMFGNKLAGQAFSYVDLAGYCSTKRVGDEYKYFTQFTGDSRIECKSRFKGIKGEVENVTYDLLRKLMKDDVVKDEDKK